jgi:hypothetical protein
MSQFASIHDLHITCSTISDCRISFGSHDIQTRSALSKPPLRDLRALLRPLIPSDCRYFDRDMFSYVGVPAFFATRWAKMGECKRSRTTTEKSVELQGARADEALFNLEKELRAAQATDNGPLADEIRIDIETTMRARGDIDCSSDFNRQLPFPTADDNRPQQHDDQVASEGAPNHPQKASSSGVQMPSDLWCLGPRTRCAGSSLASSASNASVARTSSSTRTC